MTRSPRPGKGDTVLGGVEKCLEDPVACLIILPAVLGPILRVLPIFSGLRAKSRPSLAAGGRSLCLSEVSWLPDPPTPERYRESGKMGFFPILRQKN